MSDNENGKGVSRRTLLGTTAAAAGVGLAGGAALTTDGKGLVTAADAQTKTAAPKAPAARARDAEDRSRARANSTNITPSSPADRPAKCASSAFRRCAN